MDLNIIEADLENPTHTEYILYLTNAYAMDEMGGGEPLKKEVYDSLIAGLKRAGNYLGFIALDGDDPVGIANCFMGFSTFYAKPLINIHDLGVVPDARGKGVGGKLIDAVSDKAKALDCCKVTLEVLDNNPARRLYERSGFRYGDPHYFFMTKLID
ncbi:MAG TPA: GNAT family N-acetyltransferase [Balneolaceae bacterium]|nr:GNAT family N-acetyltransferase [Balneolaceae bacterium]|tara:strand:- start:29888 stop:30355 length:468 start_codon:yes stop_codon:yes gene_type:complete